MDGQRDAKQTEEKKTEEILWVKLPRTGQVTQKLDESGAADVMRVDPKFGNAPYCVQLGLGVGEDGSTRYGTPDSRQDGDYFYAEVAKAGLFNVHLKARSLRNQHVTIVWWATPQPVTCVIGPTIGPTVGPTPTPLPIGLTARHFNPDDFPGRYVNEVPSIDSEFIRRLSEAQMRSLATLASADATHVAGVLDISEVHAMQFIYEARLLLQGKTRK